MTKQELDDMSRREVKRRALATGIDAIDQRMLELLAAYWVQGWLAGYKASEAGVKLETK